MNHMIYCEVLREENKCKETRKLGKFLRDKFYYNLSQLSDDKRKKINDKPSVVDSSDAKQHKKKKREQLFKNVNSNNQIVQKAK